MPRYDGYIESQLQQQLVTQRLPQAEIHTARQDWTITQHGNYGVSGLPVFTLVNASQPEAEAQQFQGIVALVAYLSNVQAPEAQEAEAPGFYTSENGWQEWTPAPEDQVLAVTHSCGHSHTHILEGETPSLAQLALDLQAQPCSECLIAQAQQAQAEDLEPEPAPALCYACGWRGMASASDCPSCGAVALTEDPAEYPDPDGPFQDPRTPEEQASDSYYAAHPEALYCPFCGVPVQQGCAHSVTHANLARWAAEAQQDQQQPQRGRMASVLHAMDQFQQDQEAEAQRKQRANLAAQADGLGIPYPSEY